MMYGVSVLPYSAYYFVHNLLNSDFKSTSTTEFVLFVVMELMFLAALVSLVGVPLERVYATFFPFRYRAARTKQQYSKSMAG
jgi:hypothetical protein